MTRPQKSSSAELLTLFLAVVACLSFVLGLSDVSPRGLALPAFKVAEPVEISGSQALASVHAVVRNDSGAGISGATVQGFWEHDRRFYWAGAAVTDRSGQATLARLPQGRVWLLAEAPALARSSSSVVLSRDPRTVSFTLHPAQALAVTVLDEMSVPIARATVLVDTADPLPFGALSNDLGVASLLRLGAMPWTVKAVAPGYESVSRTGVRGAVTLTLRRLASLELTVLDQDGKPAVGASVMIGGPMLWPARSAVTDGAGRARISGLLAGSYDLRAILGNSVSPTLLGFELLRGANDKLTLTLEPGRTVIALVTDGEGASPIVVPNADVVLAEGGVSSFPIRGRTGSDGKVALGPIAAGAATLGARAEDFVGSALVAVPDVLNGPVPVPLTRGATIRGDVSDARGYPVEGATIEVVGSDATGLPIAETPSLVGFRQNHFAWSLPGPLPLIPAGELGVMPGPVPAIPKPGADPALSVNSADFEAPVAELPPWQTNRGGQFTAHPITPGRVRVIVRHPDYVEGTSALVSVAPGGEAQLKIVLLKGGSLEGRVVDEHDQPIAGVEVELSSPNATRTELATTASDGTFAFAAVPSDLTISLARPEDPAHVVLRKSLHLAEGTKQTLSLVLPAMRDAVHLVVLGEDERPIELVELTVTSLEPTRPMRLTRFSDAQGAVTIADAFGENLRISAEAPGYCHWAQTFAAAPKELKLVLKRGLIVEGRVTAVRGRRMVAGAVVTLQQDGVRKMATTDADGMFRVRDIAPGEVQVRVEHPDFASEETALRVDATGRVDRAFSLPDIDLAEAGEIEGEVVDERGERVAGARVMVGDVPSYVPAGRLPRGVVLSDQDGHFLLGGVHPGSASISAVSSAAGRGSAHVSDVSSGHATRNVRIVLGARATGSDADPIAPGSVAVTLGERGSAPNIDVVVVNVAEASEAERAGVQAGDVLVALDGARPTSMVDARAKLAGQPGSDLVLEVQRADARLKFRVLREAIRR